MTDHQYEVDLMLLEHLLTQREVDERIVKHFYDKHFYGGACIPAAVQCRLLLRVLGDEFEAGRCNFTMASLDALEALQAYSAADLSAFPSLAEPRKLHPSAKLMLEIKTRLVLSGDKGVVAMLSSLFPDREEVAVGEQERRHELLQAIDNPSQAEKLRAKHIKILRGCMSHYLSSAQKALGPTALQELHELAGKQGLPLWTRGEVSGPNDAGAEVAPGGAAGTASGSRGKRQHSLLDAQLDELGACRSKLRAVVGDDPLKDVAGEAAETRQERPRQSLDSPSSPVSQTTKDDSEGRQAALERDMQAVGVPARRSSGGQKASRHRKRWSEEETKVLSSLVSQIGRGKWAQILEAGKQTFQGRTQVDLKDKWRNLVKYHGVPPDGEASNHEDGQQAAAGDPIDTD